MKINYGIVAYTAHPTDPEQILVLHFCGYENQPSNNDFLSLTDELNTDPEFELVGRIGVDVFLMESPPEIVEDIAEQAKDL